jgi:hypothetical protein
MNLLCVALHASRGLFRQVDWIVYVTNLAEQLAIRTHIVLDELWNHDLERTESVESPPSSRRDKDPTRLKRT